MKQFFLYRLYFLPILILLAVRRGFVLAPEIIFQSLWDQFLVAFSLVDSYFMYGVIIFLLVLYIAINIILNQTDMYISMRFSSDTQKMDVTNKNIYRESLLTSSKLENFIKIKENAKRLAFSFDHYIHFRDILFIYFLEKKNEYQADGLNYTRNPGFKEKRYGLDCIEPWIGAETQWKLIIVNLFQSNIEESPILHCDKNSMNLMLFIK
ncbi:hypothetical protein ACJX0J_000070 [Zea mays]